MERLNRTSAPQAKRYTEKIIQFGEGNFLRAFIEWIIWKTNQKTDFNASVVVVQPIEKGLVEAKDAKHLTYFRDENNIHYVPKLTAKDVLL